MAIRIETTIQFCGTVPTIVHCAIIHLDASSRSPSFSAAVSGVVHVFVVLSRLPSSEGHHSPLYPIPHGSDAFPGWLAVAWLPVSTHYTGETKSVCINLELLHYSI